MLKRFLVWLLRGKPPIHLTDGRIVERKAEFRAEPREARKKRLRALRERRKKGLLSNEKQQILDGLEGSSVYSNAYAAVYQRKPAGNRAPNIQETKRLYVAKLVYEKLCPEKNVYEFLESETSYDEAAPRAIEMRLREFEKEWIESRKLTCRGVVEEQFGSFKRYAVMSSHQKEYGRLRRMPIMENYVERIRFFEEQGRLMAFTDSERALLASLCE